MAVEEWLFAWNTNNSRQSLLHHTFWVFHEIVNLGVVTLM